MRKSLLMVLAVLLLPAVASAQYWGYNPGAHNPDKIHKDVSKAWSEIRGFFRDVFSSSSSVRPNTTSGAGYIPPASYPRTTSNQSTDSQADRSGSFFARVLEKANAEAAKKARRDQLFPQGIGGGVLDPSPWNANLPTEDTLPLIYGYCWGIYDASKATGNIESDNAKAALAACDQAVDVLAESMNSCPNPETVAPAREAGRSWWQKNVSDPYFAGYDAVGRSYMIQSKAMGKTAEEIGDWFCEKWKQLTDWICGN